MDWDWDLDWNWSGDDLKDLDSHDDHDHLFCFSPFQPFYSKHYERDGWDAISTPHSGRDDSFDLCFIYYYYYLYEMAWSLDSNRI